MNRIYIFILGSIMVCLQACHNYEEPLWDDKSMVQTRAIVDEYRPSSSNPDLLTNWENLEEIVLNTEKPTGGGYKVDVPWTDGISSNLSESFRKNIKKEDGWKMLFHTFKEVGLNKGLNYMCFYNQFIGCIKVFYYNEEAVLSQGAQWYIKTNGGIKTKMLDEVAYLSITAAEPATNDMLILSNLADVPTTGIVRGWNGFEFSFPYSTDLPIGDIKIGAYEKHITDYNITGKEFLTSLGTITTTQQSSTGLSKALANITGPIAGSYIKKLGEGVFGNTVILGKKITDLINNIPGSSVASIINKGLNLIFGRTSTISTSDIKLTTSGTIEMTGTGTSETTSVIPTLNFNLYNILNPSVSSSNTQLVTNTVSTGNHYLGAWTLEKTPEVSLNRFVQVWNQQLIPNGHGYTVKGNVYTPSVEKENYKVIINPDILPYIKSSNISVKYVECTKLDGKEIAGLDMHSRLQFPLIYSDENRTFYETESYRTNINGDFSVSGNPQPLVCWYDWGDILTGKWLAVVCVDLKVEYEGKINDISQSRVYTVDFKVDDELSNMDDIINHPPYSVIINEGKPFFPAGYFYPLTDFWD